MVLRVAVASSRRPFTFVNPCREGQAAFSGVLVQLLPGLMSLDHAALFAAKEA